MQRKKNPQADLRKYSSLMFALGLCLVLFISWQAIEYKTYERQYDLESLNVEDDDDEVERLKKLGDKYSKIANSLKNQTQKSNYLKECSELFYHDKFEEKLDSKCTIIGFKNGVFDLETYEFRDGHPDDFLSFSTNIDYVKYDDDSDVNAEIMDFIDKILPKEEMKTYLLKLFSSFLSGHIKDEKFHIFKKRWNSHNIKKIYQLFFFFFIICLIYVAFPFGHGFQVK